MAKSNVIKIESTHLNGEDVQTVNARDLHAGLEIGKDFSTWVKDQIDRARLVESRDFEVFTQKGENPLGGRPMQEYYFTVDAAKHIAMMSNTDKGFEIREYFIAVEKDYKALLVAHARDKALMDDPDFDRRVELAMSVAKVRAHNEQLQFISKKYVEFVDAKQGEYEAKADAELGLTMRDYAKARLEFLVKHADKLMKQEAKKSKLPPGMVLSQLPNWR